MDNENGKYVHVERRKVIIEMSFRAGNRPSGKHRRERTSDEETVRRMKREGMFV